MKEEIFREIEGDLPYDQMFPVGDGRWEMCHCTGRQMSEDGGDIWWSEFEDQEGNLYYGN